MIRTTAVFLIAAALAACASQSSTRNEAGAKATASAQAPRLSYPSAARGDTVDDYHGTQVADPYRWMENLDAPELKAWIDQENAITQQFLADTPRDRIKARLTELWNYERFGVPEERGGNYFYTRNDGLQNQAPVYVQKGMAGAPRLLLDPNTLSQDGTVALAETAPSDDGRRFAYSLSDGGSDWRTIKVRDVETGKDLPDEVRWAKFTSIAWARDGKGFYYQRYDEPRGENELKALNRSPRIHYHRLGTPQSSDPLVYQRTDQPDWLFGLRVSDDGRYLVIEVRQGTDNRNLLFYKDLQDRAHGVRALVRDRVARFEFIGNQGATFFVRTDADAERYRVVAIDLRRPDRERWRTVIPQDKATLDDATMVGRQLVANYLADAHSAPRVFDLDGKPLRAIELPGLGTAGGFTGSARSTESFFSFSSYVTPAAIYRYDAKAGTVSPFKTPRSAFDASPYETRQVFYASKDGTRIPMFVTAKRGLSMDGSNPTILYGYGGFNQSMTPTFSANIAGWLEMGGVYAVANLRGGGEYGRSWHEGGMKTRKQNVFDDFASAAEYLIAEKVTSPKKLAISGRSNGGLLVGATMLQRPELFGAALPAVGVMDMLRFREFTIGWAWESDYGSVKNADEFQAIRAYSPLHNVRPGVEYPPTLVTTADRDDRVFPAHSFKFAAELQQAYRGPAPMLIRVETRAGHGAGKSTAKVIEETADIYAFLVKTLGMPLS